MVDIYYKTVVSFPYVTGLPADVSINTWAFKHEGATDLVADANSIHDRLENFYESIMAYYSSRVDPSQVTFRTYNLADSEPRVPVYEEIKSLTGGTAANMDFPSEVAMCLSFKALPVSGANARRRRGRVYLGPLQSSTTTDYYQVLGAMITATLNGADTNLAANTGDIIWSIYSKYTHYQVPVGDKYDPDVHSPNNALLPQAFSSVHKFWCDNEWDTQRRRGLKASARNEMTV